MSQATGGAMTAIIGLKEDILKTILHEHALTNVAIANYNSHTQLVLSGQQADINQACIVCEQAGAAMVVPLKVSGAFHSPYMKSAQEQFETFLNDFQFSAPKLPIIANCTAEPYPSRDADIKKILAQQMTSPVRWTDSIDYLLSQGETEFIEAGPGVVLTGLIGRIKNGQ